MLTISYVVCLHFAVEKDLVFEDNCIRPFVTDCREIGRVPYKNVCLPGAS